MQGGASRTCLLLVVALLLALLYPALFLGYRVAPEASLKSAPPWRELSGPLPRAPAAAFEAATQLGARLASVARDPLGSALWNPWIGGGRPGWLAGAEQGGAPLALISAVAARPGWAWTSLLAFELASALLGAWWAFRRAGLVPAAAAVGATAYAFSGAVTGHLLDWQGSALALGPLALGAALLPSDRWTRRAATWAAALLVLGAGGAPALQFVALAAAAVVVGASRGGRSRLWLPAALAIALAAGVGLPRAWLAAHGGEPGAARSLPPVCPPIASWTAAVAAGTGPEQFGDAVAAESPAGSDRFVFVGAATAALAIVGLLSAPTRQRGFWIGVALVAIAAASAPSGMLQRLGVSQRPFGALALAVAALAAFGAQTLFARVPVRAAPAAAFAIWLLLALSLVPRAAHQLPFAPAEDTQLACPVSADDRVPQHRLVGVLGAMPPDSAALVGLADVRASSFRDEPRYGALLGSGAGGEMPLARALDLRTVRLGARWLLEPLPLRVVSGDVFSRIEQTDLPGKFANVERTALRVQAAVPAGATRLGIQVRAEEPVRARIERGERSADLERDETLQAESAAWTWFAVPAGFAGGPAFVTVSAARPWSDVTVPFAWDASGLRLGSEQRGVRVWEWAEVRPFAFLARGVQRETSPAPSDVLAVAVPDERLPALLSLVSDSGGKVDVTRVNPHLVTLEASAPAPALLVAQVKFRPALWRATVDGTPVATERVDGVWTALRVPAGSSRVELVARLPGTVWGTAVAALLGVGLLASTRRRS